MSDIGPDSFAPRGTNYSQASAAAPLQITNQSGANTNTSAAQFRPGSINYIGQQSVDADRGAMQEAGNWDATSQWLMKAAGEQIAPYVGAYQQSLAMRGIQEVASGKAIQEIIDEQPAYSRIFGDSDLITTARAYTAQEQVSRFTQQVTSELAGRTDLNPETARQYLLKAMDGFQTGDMLTDAVTNQAMIPASEQILSQWTKQNYKVQQFKAKTSQRDSWVAQGDSFQAQAKAHFVDGTISADSLNVITQNLISSLAPVNGQDPHAYATNLSDAVRAMSQNGDFHAVRAIGASGALNYLTPEERQGMDEFVRQQEALVGQQARITPKYAAAIQTMALNIKTGKKSPAQVLIDLDSINREAQKEYGFSNPLISPKEIQGAMGDATDFSANQFNRLQQMYQDQALKEAQKKGDQYQKDLIQTRKTDEAQKLVSSGLPIPSGYDETTMQHVAANVFDQLEGQQQGSGYRAVLGGYINSRVVYKELQNRFTAPLTTAGQTEWNVDFDKKVLPPFQTMMAAPGGKEMAVAYYGKDNYLKMSQYTANLANGDDPRLAYHNAFVLPGRLGDISKLNKDDTDSLTDAIVDGYEAQFPDLDFQELGEAAQRTVLNRATSNLATIRTRPGLDGPTQFSEAARLAMHDGTLALYGPWAWDRDSTQPPIHKLVEVTPAQTYGLMRTHLENSPAMRGVNLDNIQIVERSAGKDSALMVFGRDGKGQYHTEMISVETLKRLRDDVTAGRQKFSNSYRTSPARATGLRGNDTKTVQDLFPKQ